MVSEESERVTIIKFYYTFAQIFKRLQNLKIK